MVSGAFSWHSEDLAARVRIPRMFSDVPRQDVKNIINQWVEIATKGGRAWIIKPF